MKIVERKIKDLIRAEYNPRELTKDQYNQLKDSLLRFGVVDPVIVNKHPDRDNIIIGGHQRSKVWEDMGNSTIPTVELNLTLEKEKELNVRLNKNTGQFDFNLLEQHFDTEQLLEWGFDEKDNIIFMDEPEDMDLIDDEIKNNPPSMKITFECPEQLQKAEIDIQELIDRKYNGAFFSVNGGEI